MLLLLNHGFFNFVPGHQLKCYWDFGWTCPVSVLVCMTVSVSCGGREKLCCCSMLCWGAAMFGSVCCCCLISWESWSIWDCRFTICLLWAMDFSSLNLTWLNAWSSLLWASSLTIWRSLWCCMFKFCFIHSMLILCLSSNSAFNLFNSKIEGGCWGWLLELLFNWLGTLSEFSISDFWWSKGELPLVGVACADCIVLLLDHIVLIALYSKFGGGNLGSALRSWTNLSLELSPSDWAYQLQSPLWG